MSHMKMCLYSYFQWCRYFHDPWVLFVTTNEFSVKVTKSASRLVSHEVTNYPSDFDLLLNSKVHKPDRFESRKPLNLTFTNI